MESALGHVIVCVHSSVAPDRSQGGQLYLAPSQHTQKSHQT
jgi:hypothetical protein